MEHKMAQLAVHTTPKLDQSSLHDEAQPNEPILAITLRSGTKYDGLTMPKEDEEVLVEVEAPPSAKEVGPIPKKVEDPVVVENQRLWWTTFRRKLLWINCPKKFKCLSLIGWSKLTKKHNLVSSWKW